MKNRVLFKHKKKKTTKKQNFVENETDIMQHVLKMQWISIFLHTKSDFLGLI
jgi:hypothetical protein